MNPADVTLPNDGEFTVVSIPLNWGMFRKLDACALTSIDRPSANKNVLFTDKLPTDVAGPRIVFLPTFPNWPAGGRVNAAILNHSATPRSSIPVGNPVALARMLPLLPRATSV